MKRKTSDLDKHIGLRLKMRRILLNMTQEDLAGKLNITFQQVQKYEKSINRISAARLYEIAQILNVEIGYFFDGFEGDITVKENIITPDNAPKTVKSKYQLSQKDIITSLLDMPSGNAKKQIFNIIREQLISL